MEIEDYADAIMDDLDELRPENTQKILLRQDEANWVDCIDLENPIDGRSSDIRDKRPSNEEPSDVQIKSCLDTTWEEEIDSDDTDIELRVTEPWLHCSLKTNQTEVKVDEYRRSDESSGIKMSKRSFTSKGRGSLHEMTSANTGALTVMSVGSRKFRGRVTESLLLYFYFQVRRGLKIQ
jgi:hypothetical protein